MDRYSAASPAVPLRMLRATATSAMKMRPSPRSPVQASCGIGITANQFELGHGGIPGVVFVEEMVFVGIDGGGDGVDANDGDVAGAGILQTADDRIEQGGAKVGFDLFHGGLVCQGLTVTVTVRPFRPAGPS